MRTCLLPPPTPRYWNLASPCVANNLHSVHCTAHALPWRCLSKGENIQWGYKGFTASVHPCALANQFTASHSTPCLGLCPWSSLHPNVCTTRPSTVQPSHIRITRRGRHPEIGFWVNDEEGCGAQEAGDDAQHQNSGSCAPTPSEDSGETQRVTPNTPARLQVPSSLARKAAVTLLDRGTTTSTTKMLS